MEDRSRLTTEARAELEGRDPTKDIIDEFVDRLVAVGAGSRDQVEHAIHQLRRHDVHAPEVVHVPKSRAPLTRAEHNRKKALRKAQRRARRHA
jgi:hypothetical protein